MDVETVRRRDGLASPPAAKDRPARVRDRHRQRDHGGGQGEGHGYLGHAENGDHPERNSEEVRPGVTHEDARRREVEDEESHAAARERAA